jgi:biopolymer transport protein ExbB/TolQ
MGSAYYGDGKCQPSAMLSSEIIAAGTLAFNLIAAVIALTWGLARVRDTVRDEIDSKRNKLEEAIDHLGHRYGETFSAIRQKISEIELYGRDTYQRRDSAKENIERFGADIKLQFTRLDNRLDRMENKIDKATSNGKHIE